MNITLIGMPGSGKTTIGRMLSEKLSWKFLDLDEMIKEKTGKYVSEILKEKGDEEVIRIENELTLAINFADTVFSPGGSIVYSPEAMKKLQLSTTIIYLQTSLEEIKKRFGENKNNERGIVGWDSKGIEKLFEERSKLHRKYAEYTVDTYDKSPEEIAEEIIKRIS